MTFDINDPHKAQPVIYKGAAAENAKAAMILIHGRGADAESILTLTEVFAEENFLYAAPQAYHNTWYPFSFLAPVDDNEPGITSGLSKINSTLKTLNEKGISTERIMLLGFSQGACLVLEYCSRFPQKFGGVVGLSGGLIGPDGIVRQKTNSNLKGSNIFIGCSDVDPHIPIERVHFTANYLEEISGNVTKKIYRGLGHTINDDEIKNIKVLMNNILKGI